MSERNDLKKRLTSDDLLVVLRNLKSIRKVDWSGPVAYHLEAAETNLALATKELLFSEKMVEFVK